MNNPPLDYPPMPQGVSESIIQPSEVFKKEVVKVAGAILFFMLVYIVLLVAACLLALLCSFIGIFIVVKVPRFITLMIGLGLVGLGLMVIFFLLKFMFKRNKVDRSGMIEVTEKEQPVLFAFVRRITQETKTPFPKKIYLSPEVNASVFYDSGFWSMFLPIRKNLLIGLGLVNSLNLSEFKAVLAHEFGHFSQRSMKLGSYVYNVNKVIHNMLFDNVGYGKALQSWAGASWYFAIFAKMTVGIVQGIQWILQKVYSVVNKAYMSLSRQMEFHADAVAAYVTGSKHLVSALRRIEASSLCYNKLFDYYNRWFAEHLKPDNLFPQHRFVMQHFAGHFNIPLEQGLPNVDAGSMAFLSNSRIKIEDQWASHPSTDDREKHLDDLNIEAETITKSAWEVFTDVEALQKKVTDKVYANVKFAEPPAVLDLALFDRKFSAIMDDINFNKAYKGFYDDREISKLDVRQLAAAANAQPQPTFDELFNPTNCQLPGRINSIKKDIEIVDFLQKGETDIKSFDFVGQKYKRRSAGAIGEKLRAELVQAEEELRQLDTRVFQFFYHHAQRNGNGERLLNAYEDYFRLTEELNKDFNHYSAVVNEINPVFQRELSITEAKRINDSVRHSEIIIRDRLRKILADPFYQPFYTPEEKTTLERYLLHDRDYFDGSNFDEEALQLFSDAMPVYIRLVVERGFRAKKGVLELQMEGVGG